MNSRVVDHEGVMGKFFPSQPQQRLGTRTKTYSLAFFSLLTLLSVALSAPVSSATLSKQKSTASVKTVKPNFAYFSGKTITLIEPGGLGGTTYEEAAIAAPLMASYLHATVNVEVISTGASIPGQDMAEAAPANGLTIGEMLPQSDLIDVVTNTPTISFPQQKVDFIGSPLPPATDMFVAPSSGIRNIKQLLKTKTPLPFLDLSARGLSDLMTRVVLGAYNVNIRLVTGYETSANLVAGFLRGDGVAMVTSFTAAESSVASGLAIPILLGTPPGKGTALYATMKTVTTAAQLAASDRPSTPAGRAAIKEMVAIVQDPFVSFFVREGTPKAYVLALDDAYRSALAQPSAHTEELNAGLSPGYVSPAASLADIKTEVKHAGIVARFLNYGS